MFRQHTSKNVWQRRNIDRSFSCKNGVQMSKKHLVEEKRVVRAVDEEDEEDEEDEDEEDEKDELELGFCRLRGGALGGEGAGATTGLCRL